MLQLPQPPGAPTAPNATLCVVPDPTHSTLPPTGTVTPIGLNVLPGIETVASRSGDGAPPVLVSSHATLARTTSATMALTRKRTENLVLVKDGKNVPSDEAGWKRPVRRKLRTPFATHRSVHDLRQTAGGRSATVRPLRQDKRVLRAPLLR